MKKLIASFLVSFAFLPFAFAAPALAASANDQIFQACQGHTDSSVCQDAQNPGTANPVNHYIHIATNIVALLVGLAAVIMIIISGFRFVTSGGNQNSVVQARNTLLWAVIGLAVAGLAWTLINFAVDKLIKT